MRTRASFLMVALALTVSGRAYAEDTFALQTLEPAPAGDRFFAVPDAAMSGHLRPSAGLLANYAHRPLRLTDSSTGENVANGELVKHQLTLNLDLSVVLFEQWLLNIDLPIAVLQSGDSSDSMAGLPGAHSGKLADLRLGSRYAFFGTMSSPVSLALAANLWLPTGSANNYTSDGGVRFRPEAIASGRVDISNQHFAYAVNAGVLLRPSQEVASSKLGSAMTFGAGAAILLAQDRVQIGPEVFGRAQFDGWETTPIEAMLGARVHLADFILGLSAGTAFTQAVGAAPLRGLVALAWSPRAVASSAPGPAPAAPLPAVAPERAEVAPLAPPASASALSAGHE